jgi:small subunit ribosomal protein S1
MDSITTAPEEQAENSPLNEIQRKAHYSGKIVKTSLAGAIVDIGLGIPGVVHISQLQAEPVNRVEDVVQVGQTVDVWVRRVFAKKNRIELTMVKPLQLEWREIKPDMVIKGKVVRIEKYGVFIDIGAERPGLVHISEISHEYIKGPEDVVKDGDDVDVKVLQVSRRKKQIKLSMKALQEPPAPAEKPAGRRSKGKGSEEVMSAEASQADNGGSSDGAEENEYVPTAMEIALRRAMEKSRDADEEISDKSKGGKKGNKQKLEDIFSRTLHSRPSN